MAIKNPSQISLLQPVAFLMLVAWIGYAIYLHSNDIDVGFQVQVLKSDFIFLVPDYFVSGIKSGGYTATFSAMAIKVMSVIPTVILLYYAIFYVLRPKKIISESVENETKGRAGVRIALIRPNYKGRTGSEIIEAVYEPDYIMLNQSKTYKPNSDDSPIVAFEKSVLNTLDYHQDCPACLKGYHSNANIYEHSLAVAIKIEELGSSGGIDPGLLRVVGLVHDIEKIIAYKKSKDGNDKVVWSEKATNYNHIGGSVVRSIPGYNNLDEIDKLSIFRACNYSHSPEKAPVECTDRDHEIITILRKADGLSTADEQKPLSSDKGVDESDLEVFVEALWTTIRSLNVNCHQGTSINEGWYKAGSPIWYVTNSLLIEKLAGQLSQDISRKYQLAVNVKRPKHPANEIIKNALIRMRLLLTEVEDVTTDDGLFNIKSGKVPFQNVRILSIETTKKLGKKVVENWGDSDFIIRIMQKKLK